MPNPSSRSTVPFQERLALFRLLHAAVEELDGIE